MDAISTGDGQHGGDRMPERSKRRRRWPAVAIWTVSLSMLLVLIAVGVSYVQYIVNKGSCKFKVYYGFSTIAGSLHTLDRSPLDGKWIEGFAYNAETNTYDAPVVNQIAKSRLAFWRMVADPALLDLGVSVGGGSSAFICPGAEGPKEPAAMETSDGPARDFPDPRRNLFYSMFNQGREGIVPRFGVRANFVIAADRSPQDDGLPLDGNSANHRWGSTRTGQYVLYGSGTSDWCDTTAIGIDEDEIYARGSDVGTRITKTTVPVDVNDTILMPVAE